VYWCRDTDLIRHTPPTGLTRLMQIRSVSGPSLWVSSREILAEMVRDA
jgi:hypothetical protein